MELLSVSATIVEIVKSYVLCFFADSQLLVIVLFTEFPLLRMAKSRCFHIYEKMAWGGSYVDICVQSSLLYLNKLINFYYCQVKEYENLIEDYSLEPELTMAMAEGRNQPANQLFGKENF